MKKRFNILFLSCLFISLTPISGKNIEKEKTEYKERFPLVKMETSMGDIIIELDRHRAPITVENFLGYVTRKQYDDTIIHRVDVNYVVQGGGFKTDLTEVVSKDAIFNESGNGLKNSTGTIAMARDDDPHSASNHFYFNLSDNKNLDPGRHWGYTVFGSVIEGEEVLAAMGDAETDYNETLDAETFPKTMIVIKKVSVFKVAQQ